MATDFHTPKLPATPTNFTLTPGMAPAAPLMRLLARFDRPKVEAFAEVSIALLDLMDGDPDVELNGDKADGNTSEDDFMDHGGSGPGCPIADTDAAVDDSACDEPTLDLEPEDGV